MPMVATPSCRCRRCPTCGRSREAEAMAENETLTVERAVELVTAYLGAWTERRSPVRRRLLAHCWSELGTFSSWTMNVHGFDAMDTHIANALRQQPRRCRRVRTSEVH